MQEPKLLSMLTTAQFEVLGRADTLLDNAGLPSASCLLALLAIARGHVMAPAGGHDAVRDVLDLVEQIDFVLAGVPVPGMTTRPSPVLH
jgi:hypothetical protein